MIILAQAGIGDMGDVEILIYLLLVPMFLLDMVLMGASHPLLFGIQLGAIVCALFASFRLVKKFRFRAAGTLFTALIAIVTTNLLSNLLCMRIEYFL